MNEIISSVYNCALSLYDDNHYAFNSVRLNCGHSLCYRCISRVTFESKCNFCNLMIDMSNYDFNNVETDSEINKNINFITNSIKCMFEEAIFNLKRKTIKNFNKEYQLAYSEIFFF